jgi:hypothetical protein
VSAPLPYLFLAEKKKLLKKKLKKKHTRTHTHAHRWTQRSMLLMLQMLA